VKHKGGWVYNGTEGTYRWDPEVEFVVQEQVYGPHIEKKWMGMNNYVEVEAAWYDQYTGELHYYNITVEKRAYYVYDFTSGTFGTYIGYEYWTYDLELDRDVKVSVLEPWNGEEPLVYVLEDINVSVEEGVYVVKFIGRVTEHTTDGARYTFMTTIFDKDGFEIYPRFYRFDENTILIQEFVAKVSFIGSSEKVYDRWMFNVKNGDWFILNISMLGNSDILRDNVTGVEFMITGYDYDWGWNYSLSMDIVSRLICDLVNNESREEVFNFTTLSRYVYGEYYGYYPVNKTGYHWEYNASSGEWEWVNSTYTDWEYGKTIGWHWETIYFDQVAGNWTTDPIPYMGSQTKVNKSILIINEMKKDLERNCITLNISVSEDAPQVSYTWNLKLGYYTYAEDPMMGDYGPHDVEVWGRDLVYFYEINGKASIVSEPELRQYVEYNGNRYLMFDRPYIVINGKNVTIKAHEYYEEDRVVKRLLVYSGDYMYYELYNGSMLKIDMINVVYVYNITYGDEWFLSFSEYPEWDSVSNSYYFVDIFENVHYIENYEFNWELVDVFNVSSEEYYLVIYDVNRTLETVSDWMEYDPITDNYYLSLTNGSVIYVYWNSTNYHYYFYDNLGGIHYIYYFVSHYVFNYEGSELVVLGPYIHGMFVWISPDGEYHELPYPGARAVSEYDLDYTEADGGKVPVASFSVIDGVLRLIEYNKMEGKNYGVNLEDPNDVIEVQVSGILEPYTEIGGEGIWLEAVGYKYVYGSKLEATDMYNIGVSKDGEGDFLYLYANEATLYSNAYLTDMANGTVYELNSSLYIRFYELDVDGQTYYSYYPYLEGESIGETYRYYILLLNGTKLYFDDWVHVDVKDIKIIESYNDTRFQFNGEFYEIPPEYYYQCCYQVYTINTTAGRMFISPDIRKGNIYTYMAAKPVYRGMVNGSYVYFYPKYDYVLRIRRIWGYPYSWHVVDIGIQVISRVMDLVVGSPKYSMWGKPLFTVTPTGALDLDGDLSTTDDQFYVKEIYSYYEQWNETRDMLYVSILWEPNTSIPNDELELIAWMGKIKHSWKFRWNETYIWYYASNMSTVSQETLNNIRSTVWDESTNSPVPGYWDIGWYVFNLTWEDIKAQAEERGWDWLSSDVQEWTWLSVGFEEIFFVDWLEDGEARSARVSLRYEYSGMFLYKDEDGDGIMDMTYSEGLSGEATHYFVPKVYGELNFTTPGARYGDNRLSGELTLPVNATIEFGVTVNGINGTFVPFFGNYWSWYDEMPIGRDYIGFDQKPTPAYVDNLMFALHFSGNSTPYFVEGLDVPLYKATIKIDQHVGNWDVYAPGGRDLLLNRSLSVNWYVTAYTEASWSLRSEEGEEVSTDNIVESRNYELSLENFTFAEINMGEDYTWEKNTTRPYEIYSQSVPMYAFEAAYVSEKTDRSISGWAISGTMYFLSVGFEMWDGFAVYEDPTATVHIGSALGIAGGEGGGMDMLLLLVMLGLASVSIVALVIVYKRRKEA